MKEKIKEGIIMILRAIWMFMLVFGLVMGSICVLWEQSIQVYRITLIVLYGVVVVYFLGEFNVHKGDNG